MSDGPKPLGAFFSGFSLEPTSPRPDPIQVRCEALTGTVGIGCGRTFTAEWQWSGRKWLPEACCPACHGKPLGQPAPVAGLGPPEGFIPEPLRGFDPKRAKGDLATLHLRWAKASQMPRVRHCLLIGPRGTGKSRAMWAMVEQLTFEANKAPKLFNFEQLAIDRDRQAITELSRASSAFIDNVGSVIVFGSTGEAIRAALLNRANRGLQTFMTVDNPDYDPALLRKMEKQALIVRTAAA